jgi:hypothetical protein
MPHLLLQVGERLTLLDQERREPSVRQRALGKSKSDPDSSFHAMGRELPVCELNDIGISSSYRLMIKLNRLPSVPCQTAELDPSPVSRRL